MSDKTTIMDLTKAIKDLSYQLYVYNERSMCHDDINTLVKEEEIMPFHYLFDEEIENAVKGNLISRNEMRVFLEITEFIQLNTGILVDKDDQPLTQSSLAEKIDISLRQMARIISKLCAAKMILKKKSGFRTVYMVNSNFAWKGKIELAKTAVDKFEGVEEQ